MLTKLHPKAKQILFNSSQAARIALCDKEFVYFCIYYFPQFFKYQIPEFHYLMYNDLKELMSGFFHYLMWCMFRESAKTSIMKMFVTYCICYRKRKYINWDSFDKDNAEAALFDIAVWLQTNDRIISDFGQLYFDDKRALQQSTMKRMGSFITTNGIKVEAFSTGEPVRGRVYEENRPDFVILDDFETNITKESAAKTANVTAHIDELLTGTGTDAWQVFLCNYITESGSVQYIMDKAEDNPDIRIRRVDVEMKGEWDDNGDYINGQIMWPDKYVRTNKEAAELNKSIEDTKRQKVSLESKKKTFGKRVYTVEMMNSPEASGDLIFDRKLVEKALAEAVKRKPFKTLGEFRMWADYSVKHRYAGGADTAKGVGRDSNASVFIDYSEDPNVVVGTYANNLIGPDLFAHELKRQGEIFGGCLLAPEINNTGYATVTELKRIYPILKIYRQIVKDTTNPQDKKTKDIGWESTVANKTEIVYQFKSAFEDGLITIYDPKLLMEMKYYTLMHMKMTDAEEETMMERGRMTRHYDLLKAACIAWEMRHYATLPEDNQAKQWRPDYQQNKTYA